MPIPTTCPCGKRVSAPDNLAGKTVKCPACQAPLTIPMSSGGANGAASAATSTGKIAARCRCGKTFHVPAGLAGKKVKCPACQEPVSIAVAKSAEMQIPNGMEVGGVGSLLDEIGFQKSAASHRCPECREDLAPDAILCIHCGYNLESGKQLKTKIVGRRTVSAGGHGGEFGGPAKAVPDPVKSVAKTLQVIGVLSLLGTALLIYLLVASQAGNAALGVELGTGTLIFQMVLSVLSVGLYFAAANMLTTGSKAAWILSVVLSVLLLISPLLPIGIFNLIKLNKPETKKYCS